MSVIIGKSARFSFPLKKKIFNPGFTFILIWLLYNFIKN